MIRATMVGFCICMVFFAGILYEGGASILSLCMLLNSATVSFAILRK